MKSSPVYHPTKCCIFQPNRSPIRLKPAQPGNTDQELIYLQIFMKECVYLLLHDDLKPASSVYATLPWNLQLKSRMKRSRMSDESSQIPAGPFAQMASRAVEKAWPHQTPGLTNLVLKHRVFKNRKNTFLHQCPSRFPWCRTIKWRCGAEEHLLEFSV